MKKWFINWFFRYEEEDDEAPGHVICNKDGTIVVYNDYRLVDR